MKKILCLLLLNFLISSVTALTIESKAVNEVIVPELNHPAKFILTITGAEEGSYNIYTLTGVKIVPASSFYLKPGKNEIEIYVYPTENLKERGYYSFSYNIRKSTGENFEDSLSVKISDLEDAIIISSDSNDPSQKNISFYVQNLENTKFDGLKARFSSIFFNFSKKFDLKPYEKLEFSVPVDRDKIKKISAGVYIVKAEFETLKGNKTIEGKIYLGEKKGIETREDVSGFLIRTKTITKINIGNIPVDVNVKIDKNIFTRLFTSFNHEPNFVDRHGFVVTYTWNKKMNPADIFIVKAKTNYIFPLLILVAAILIIIGFKRYIQTKVEVKKSVSPVKTKTGHFALRVNLTVKARKRVENLSLIDKIPAIVKVYEKFGASKPSSIDTKNRRIQWDIGDLNPGEERVFSYIIYSKLGIVGKFTLPEALAVFEIDGEIHEVESNSVFFLSEQVKGEE